MLLFESQDFCKNKFVSKRHVQSFCFQARLFLCADRQMFQRIMQTTSHYNVKHKHWTQNLVHRTKLCLNGQVFEDKGSLIRSINLFCASKKKFEHVVPYYFAYFLHKNAFQVGIRVLRLNAELRQAMFGMTLIALYT